jgi:hypothetical protein
MDDKVHEMISKNIDPSEIIIQSKGKIGEYPDRFLIGILDQLFHPVPGKNLDVDIGILKDIGPVIEIEGYGERIRIS